MCSTIKFLESLTGVHADALQMLMHAMYLYHTAEPKRVKQASCNPVGWIAVGILCDAANYAIGYSFAICWRSRGLGELPSKVLADASWYVDVGHQDKALD